MLRYVIKRVLLLIPVIIGVSFVIFFCMNLASGDYVDTLDTDNMTEEQINEMRERLNLSGSLLERYVRYMWKLLHGDLGVSYISKESVFDSFMSRIGATAQLAFASTFVCIVISIPLGIYSARHNGTVGDNISSVFAVLGLSIPNFWLGLMLIIAFALYLGWLPSGGNDDGIRSIILPAITVGTGKTAMLMRTTRSSMLDTLRQDYLRTARAKGVTEKQVINKHALKNALIPIINVALTQLATSFGGAALTETVFAWPGVGKMIVDAVKQRDVPMVCGCLILKCIIISVIGLITDLLYVFVDPRLKTQFVTGSKKRRAKING